MGKSKPGELTYASTGVGTPGHLNGELFSRLAGIKAIHVPYRVVGQAVTDFVAGRIAFWIAPIPTMLQNVRQGQLKPLAVAGGQRSADLPGVPTVQKDPVELLRRSARPDRPSLSRHPLGEQRGTLFHPGVGEVIVGLEEVIDRKGHFLNVLKDGRVEVGPERGFQ